MKSKISLILGIVLLFLSLPVIMGNGETESEPKDKKEQLQKEIERYNGLSNLASEQITDNKAKLAEIEASKKALGEKITMAEDRADGYQTLEEILSKLDDAAQQFAESEQSYDELYNNYTQVEESKGPVNFESAEDVEDWLSGFSSPVQNEPQNTTEKINWARKLQAAGLNDGQIININFFHNQATGQYEVRCTTNVKGTMYWWKAGSSDVNADTDPNVKAYKQFKSGWYLEYWLGTNSVSNEFGFATGEEWVQAAQQLCADAAAEGYYITYTTQSIDGKITAVECSVNINGVIYYVNPRDDTVSGTSSIQ